MRTPSLVPTLLLVLLIASLLPGAARAADEPTDDPPAADDDASDEGEATDPTAALPGAPPPRLDALGRVYPDPRLQLRSQRWLGGGAALTGAGAGLLVGGISLGTAFLRGEVEPPAQGTALVLLMAGSGVAMAFVGLPMASAGSFMRGQLLRTIKGAEKVPRVVANEGRYWTGYAAKMYSQGMQVSGGGAILLGIIAVVAVGSLVGTDQYDARFWFAAATPFAVGASMLVGGLLLKRAAEQHMEAVWNEVDPMRQQPLPTSRRVRPRPGLPVATAGPSRSTDGRDGVRFDLRWGLSF